MFTIKRKSWVFCFGTVLALSAGTVAIAGCSDNKTANPAAAAPAGGGVGASGTKTGASVPHTSGEAQPYQEKMKAEPGRVPNAR